MSVRTGTDRIGRLLGSVAVVAVLSGSLPFVALAVGLSAAHAAVVNRVEVRGNQRIDAETVRSYLTVTPGESFTTFDTDQSLRALFATGLFRDVTIAQSGGALVVTVDEYPTVSRVIFEGNDKVKEEQLRANVQLKSRSVLSDEVLASDRERVRDIIARSGRSAANVTTEVVELGNNRVNVVFRIDEGGRTKVRKIDFVGNGAFGDRRLREVVSLNESNLLSWLKRDDVYDPDRLRADEERLRRFYYNRGYADFQIIASNAELDPVENEYVVTFTIEEGEQYRFGSVAIDNTLSQVDEARLASALEIKSGEVYAADEVEKSLVAVTERIALDGFAFAQVTPRGERNPDDRTIDITFFVDEGPRVYVDRIIIRGNNRTRDFVIRREFDIAEGDAYNRVLVNRAKTRLEALGFFESVRISTQRGSSEDRVDVVVDVVDKATGELSIGGGYSTNGGAVAELSFSEANFLGRGQFVKIAGGLGQDATKYSLSFTEPYFLGRRLAAGFDLSLEQVDSTDQRPYEQEIFTFRPRLATRLTDEITFGVNYQYKQEEFTDPGVSSGGVDRVNCDDFSAGSYNAALQESICKSPYVTSSIGWSLNYADLDNFKSPREGFRARISQDFAGVGGDASYIKTEGKVAGYWLASQEYDIVFSGLLGAGHIASVGEDIRVVDNFYQGSNIVRGFEPAGIGPRDLNGISLGGTTYAHATAEVQFPLPLLSRGLGLRGALFADAGTLYGNDNSAAIRAQLDPAVIDRLDDAAIRASVGASILWDSPFGPLRADVAYPVAKESYDKEQLFRFGVTTRF